MLDEPEVTAADGTRYNRQPPALQRPDETAAELDAWSARHREDAPDSSPVRHRRVSDGLRRMDPLSELMDLSNRRRRPRDAAWRRALDRIGGDRPDTEDDGQTATDFEQIAELFEREARVYQHLADVVAPAQSTSVRSATMQDYATEADKSRALAAQYRRDAAAIRAADPPPADHTAPNPQPQPEKDSDPRQHDPRYRMLGDWLNKARFANSLAPTQPWPAWSTGELLAVAAHPARHRAAHLDAVHPRRGIGPAPPRHRTVEHRRRGRGLRLALSRSSGHRS